MSKDWASRARCARAFGAVDAADAAALRYNNLGVCMSTTRVDSIAARALLGTGSQVDCTAADLVTKQLLTNEEVTWSSRPGGHARNLTRSARAFHDTLAARGFAPIPASWGLRALLEHNELASRLRASLDERQSQAADGAPLPLSAAPAGNQPTSYRKRWLPWEHDGHILPRDRAGWYSDGAWRNLTAELAARLRPPAHAYIGGGAVTGLCRLLILPARNLTASEYPSGLWHHDRCGKRLKCFVFLNEQVTF